MSKRTKINFETVNNGEYEIISSKKIAESNERIKKEMKKKKRILIPNPKPKPKPSLLLKIKVIDPLDIVLEEQEIKVKTTFNDITRFIMTIGEHKYMVTGNGRTIKKLNIEN